MADCCRYRLFGRKVQPDRRCTSMNISWRNILRTRALASVKIHRQPAGPTQASLPVPVAQAAVILAHSPSAHGSRPYIHLLFKPERADAWMTEFESWIPKGWLVARGFEAMEYFDIKVGVARI